MDEMVAKIKAKVSSDPRWAERAIVALLARQTSDEQEAQTTKYHNAMGFSAFDAEILTSFGQQIQRGRALSAKQLAIAYKRLPRYAKQLAAVAAAKAA